MNSSVKTQITVTIAGQTFTWACTALAGTDDTVEVVVERTDYAEAKAEGKASTPISVKLHAERKVEIDGNNAKQFAGRLVKSPRGEIGVIVGVVKEESACGEYSPSVLLGVEYDEWAMRLERDNRRSPVEFFTKFEDGAYRLAAEHEFGWFAHFGTYTLLD